MYQPDKNRNILIICSILFLEISAKKYKIRWSDEGYNFTGIRGLMGVNHCWDKTVCLTTWKDRKLLAKEKKKKGKDQKKARSYGH